MKATEEVTYVMSRKSDFDLFCESEDSSEQGGSLLPYRRKFLYLWDSIYISKLLNPAMPQKCQ